MQTLPKMKTTSIPSAVQGRNQYNYLIPGVDSSQIGIISSAGKSGYINVSIVNSLTLKKIKNIKVRNKYAGKSSSSDYFYITEGRVYYMYGYYDKKQDKYKVYGQILNMRGKAIKREHLLISYDARKRKNIGSISIIANEDKTNFLLYRNPPDGKFVDEELTLALFDNNLEKQYSKKYKVSSTSLLADLVSISLSNDGMAFMTIQEFKYATSKSKRKSKKVLGKSEFKFYTVDEESDLLEEIKIKNRDKNIYSVYTKLDEAKGKMIVTGLYNDLASKSSKSKRRSKYTFNGVYYITLDLKDWTADVEQFSKISDKTLRSIVTVQMSDKKKKKTSSKLANKDINLGRYYLRNVITRSDLSTSLILEKSYVVENCSTDPKTGARTCTYTYYDLEILQFNIDPEGSLKQTVIIPKRQVSGTSYYHGFASMLDEEGHIVYVFNDSYHNYNPKKQAKVNNKFAYNFSSSRGIFSKPKNIISAVFVDEKGKFRKKFIIKDKKNPLWLVTKKGISTGKHRFVSPMRAGKKSKALTVSSIGYNLD